ncbi:MAG: HNH endonuclease [bacterium]|nr:HNH endonuclease [bacterium]
MRFYVGLTDYTWYKNLSSIPNLDEVNFWKPHGRQRFYAINYGEFFIFRLHSPYNYIVGGGVFAYFTFLPISLAWKAFGIKNGALSYNDLYSNIKKRRSLETDTIEDFIIGCILLEQPFFFAEHEWIPIPSDWHRNFGPGIGYNTSEEAGKYLWNEIQNRLNRNVSEFKGIKIAEEQKRYGKQLLVKPRLGQGSFRIMVIDNYQRRCSVTLEKTLPALEAAHIHAYRDNGPNELSNGILLRSDLHNLLDSGYVTISKDYHFEVSKKIKEEYENGREYYNMHGRKLNLPANKNYWPEYKYVEWHNNNIYKG